MERLQNFDQKLKRGHDLYIQERERKSKTAQDHNLQSRYVSDTMKEKEYFFDLAKMHKGFTRIQKSEKLQ